MIHRGQRWAERALAEAAKVHDAIERARKRPLPSHGSLSTARAEELLDHIRVDRKGR